MDFCGCMGPQQVTQTAHMDFLDGIVEARISRNRICRSGNSSHVNMLTAAEVRDLRQIFSESGGSLSVSMCTEREVLRLKSTQMTIAMTDEKRNEKGKAEERGR